MEHWYALYTKPNREYQVCARMKETGAETYLPTVRRRIRRRDRPDQIVYFPCYLFARLDFEVIPRSTIDWMPGVRRIVSAGNQPTIVAEEIVQLIRRRLEGKEQVGYGGLRQGDSVRITSGPLRDLEAVFDQPVSAANRVCILLEVMGRMTQVEIDYSQIKRI
jgi:transcription elongation factor/antiterminator RfaH